MTRFDTDLASRGWALIAEGAQMISLAYAASEQPAAGGASSAAAPPGPQSSPAPADPPLSAQVDAGLGVCPIHGVHWTVKAAGTSKNGKPYPAFYRCNERDGEEYCKERPQKVWADTHPIREVAA